MAEDDEAIYGERCTSLGVPVGQVLREINEKRQQQTHMAKEIHDKISNVSLDDLCDMAHYFISFNNLIKTDGGFVVPGEIAIGEFTLKGGIIRVFHSMIFIRDIPRGYSGNARDISEKRSGIPIPPDCVEGAEKDAAHLLLKILRFLHQSPDERAMDLLDYVSLTPPSLYTLQSDLEEASECFGAIFSECNLDCFAVPQILPIDKLFHEILKKMVPGNGDPSFELFATDLLTSHPFDFSPGISCPFHEQIDKNNFCSQSTVYCYAYTISAQCCKHLGIEMLEGKHYPISLTHYQLLAEQLEKERGFRSSESSSSSRSHWSYKEKRCHQSSGSTHSFHGTREENLCIPEPKKETERSASFEENKLKANYNHHTRKQNIAYVGPKNCTAKQGDTWSAVALDSCETAKNEDESDTCSVNSSGHGRGFFNFERAHFVRPPMETVGFHTAKLHLRRAMVQDFQITRGVGRGGRKAADSNDVRAPNGDMNIPTNGIGRGGRKAATRDDVRAPGSDMNIPTTGRLAAKFSGLAMEH